MTMRNLLIGVMVTCVLLSRFWVTVSGLLAAGADSRTLQLAVGLGFGVLGRIAVWLLILSLRKDMAFGARCSWLLLSLFDSAIALALFAVLQVSIPGTGVASSPRRADSNPNPA